MPSFGKTSRKRLDTCRPELVEILEEAIKIIDFSVLEGVRSKEAQNLYFIQGKSKLKWPRSKHNVLNPSEKSRAVDIAPYPIDWEDEYQFILLAGIVLGIAHSKGIKIRWGGDWNGDNKFNENFVDMPHFELEE